MGHVKSLCVDAKNEVLAMAATINRQFETIEQDIEAGKLKGDKGDKGEDGKDGSPIYPEFTVDPHNMHLYCDQSDRYKVDARGHLIVTIGKE